MKAMSALRILFQRRRCLSVLVLSVLSSGTGHALERGMAPCTSPFVFPESAANVVVVQYGAAAEEPGERRLMERLTETGARLGWLIKMDAWHLPTYGSLGIVAHIDPHEPESCDPVAIRRALLGQGGFAGRTLRPGQVAAFVSGRIFQEGEEIFLQTEIRAFRVGDDMAPLAETLAVSLSDDQGGELAAGLPLGSIVFPPRRLTTRDLDRVAVLYQEAGRLYDAPSPEADSRTIQLDSNGPLAFSVRGLDEQWLEVRSEFTGLHGYLRVDPAIPHLLHARMPELDFLNGVLGFLRLRQSLAGDMGPLLSVETAGSQIRRSFARFEEGVQAAKDSDQRALAAAIAGATWALNDTVAGWRAARADFLRAIDLAPQKAAYHVLAALADARLCCAQDQPRAAGHDPVARLVDALARDPRNEAALRGLDAVFGYLEASEAAGDAFPTLDTRGLSVRRALVRETLVARGLAPATDRPEDPGEREFQPSPPNIPRPPFVPRFRRDSPGPP